MKPHSRANKSTNDVPLKEDNAHNGRQSVVRTDNVNDTVHFSHMFDTSFYTD